jgi:hypothetical protein
MPFFWQVPREWPDETAFIIAGGPSVASQPVELLDGRRVIVVNSSYALVPWAPFLFFGDSRWWGDHAERVLSIFRGRIVTAAAEARPSERLLKLRKQQPPGLAEDTNAVRMRRTSLSGAINLAAHLGAAQIVLLGADGGPDASGRTHHHAPHRWDQLTHCWRDQRSDMETLVAPLAARGIRVINASPGSKLADLWPVMPLCEALISVQTAMAA